MAPRTYNFGFAGENFAFTLPDAGEGSEQTQSVLANYFPELKLTFAPKGTRGGRLGRSSSQVTKEVTFGPGGAPGGAGVSITNAPVFNNNVSAGQTAAGTVDTTAAQAKVPTKAQKLLSEFIGTQGEAGILGAEGLGRAKEYGYTTDQIKEMASKEGLKFGATAATSLGLGNLSSYTGSLATEGALGMSAVQKARAAGLSDQAIRELAKRDNLKLGTEAARALNVSTAEMYQPPAAAAPQPTPAAAPAPSRAGGAFTGTPASTYNPGGSLSSFVGSAGTSGAMGASAVQRAMESGLSAQQIISQAQKQGVSFGPAALAALKKK